MRSPLCFSFSLFLSIIIYLFIYFFIATFIPRGSCPCVEKCLIRLIRARISSWGGDLSDKIKFAPSIVCTMFHGNCNGGSETPCESTKQYGISLFVWKCVVWSTFIVRVYGYMEKVSRLFFSLYLSLSLFLFWLRCCLIVIVPG